MKAEKISTQTDQNNIAVTSIKSESPNSKLFILLIAILLFSHYFFGYIQTPNKVIEAGIQQGIIGIYIKLGYALGIFCIFALPLPLGISLLSLFMKTKRNFYSFAKILFWCLVSMLPLNILIGFVYAPRVIQNIQF